MDIALVSGTQDRPGLLERVDGPLGEALAARGAQVHRPLWHDPEVDWSRFAMAVVRTTWDYAARRDEFVAWAARADEVTTVANPPDALRWNTHKSYLIELEERGAPVIPTAWLGRGDRVVLADLLAARGWPRAVAKPAVGAGSAGVLRVGVDLATPVDVAADLAQEAFDRLLATGDVMVQPYLDAVTAQGELSIVLFEGEVVYAVRKHPPAGDFRVQERHGGRYVREPVDAAAAELARWVADATGADLLFARVDLLDDASGTPQLTEIELTEPDLYFRFVDGSADRLAEAILARAGG